MALTNPQEVIVARPVCCEYTAGRVFYGQGNTVYYSQVMEGNSISSISECYQQNDPTSEHVSDLLATDGGTVQVDNATEIVQIKKFSSGVLIYAKNGVWYLGGTEGGFTATNFSLTLVHEAGCVSPQAVVTSEATQYYWSDEGVYAIALNEYGKPIAQNIVEGVLQSYYNDIPAIAKAKASGAYNRVKKQIEWIYPTTAQTGATNYKYACGSALVLDTRTGGMWPQEYNASVSESAGNFLASIVNTTQGSEDEDSMFVSVVTGTPSSTQTYSLQMVTKTDMDFQDFGSNYTTAYIETGYETLDKPSNKKVAPYITTHFLQTEENWVSDGSGGLELDLQSGCQMRAKWDWNNSDSNGRWSPAQQAYRFRRVFVPDVAGAFNSGEQVITTKNKMLGRGSALSVRFEQEAGKDMKLLGYTTLYSVKGRM